AAAAVGAAAPPAPRAGPAPRPLRRSARVRRLAPRAPRPLPFGSFLASASRMRVVARGIAWPVPPHGRPAAAIHHQFAGDRQAASEEIWGRGMRQARFSRWGLAVLAALPAAAMAAAPTRWQLNMGRGVTEAARHAYEAHMLALWICVAIGAVVFLAMGYAMFKF